MKKCSRCKESKPIEEFYLRADGKSKDGVQSNCKLCSKEKKRIWYGKHSSDPKVRLNHAKATAKGRGLGFTISLKKYSELLLKGCYYCEVDLTDGTGTGLDRVNCDKGYTPSNVVPCCAACNIGRNINFTSEEWKIMIAALKEWRRVSVPTRTPT